MRFLPEDQPNQVDAVSGCCLMARREVVEDIGLLDEELKQWGEDIEWCVRAKKSGWEVWYAPQSVITHLKGQRRPACRSVPCHKEHAPRDVGVLSKIFSGAVFARDLGGGLGRHSGQSGRLSRTDMDNA